MPATNKVGTQLLVDEWVRADGQALALIRQDSVASIWRYLIEAQLPVMKSAHYVALSELDKALAVIGQNENASRADLLDTITKMKVRYGDLFEDGMPVSRLPLLRKVS